MSIGLVFSGGGGKGAYQIGVWKALKEYGLDKEVSAISGTSVGAFNAVLFMQGNIKLAENLWLSMNRSKLMFMNPRKIILKLMKISLPLNRIIWLWYLISLSFGFFTRKGLIDVLNENVDFHEVFKSRIPCYVTCSKLPCLHSKYFKINNKCTKFIRRVLLASTALPFIYDSIWIDGCKYIDGGLTDNVPIWPLYECGCKKIIVVHFHKHEKINSKKYLGTKIYEILPRESQGGFINGTLDFSPKNIKRRIQQGYCDTVKMIDNICNS